MQLLMGCLESFLGLPAAVSCGVVALLKAHRLHNYCKYVHETLPLTLGFEVLHNGSAVATLLLQESLVPVPTQLFQGSLLLGSIANAVLGESAMSNSNVLIHPVLIGGWCGLVATALNSLPVGSLDGGKMTQVVWLPTQASDMEYCGAVFDISSP